MNIIQSCTNTFTPSFLRSGSSADFQQAINDGKSKQLSLLVKDNPTFISNPLPNGELPLHFAIRQSQPQSIATLLELGADPAQKDDQGFDAIATSLFMEDYATFTSIFEKDIEKNQDVAKNLRAGNFKGNEDALIKHVETNSAQVKKLNKSIIDSFNVKHSEKIPHEFPLHVAIALDDKDVLKAIFNRPDIETFLNQTESKGMTVLECAAALGRVDLMLMIITKRKELGLETSLDSAFALLVTNLNKINPLNISKLDIAVSLVSFALSIVRYLPAGLLNPQIILALDDLKTVPLEMKNPKLFLLNLGAPSFIAYNFPSNQQENILTLVPAIQASYIGVNALKGMNSCYRNASFGTGKAVLKATISYLPSLIYSTAIFKNIAIAFKLITEPKPEAIDDLSKNNFSCYMVADNVEHGLTCMGKAAAVYENCVVDPLSLECTTSKTSLSSFMDRMFFWNAYKYNRDGSPEFLTWFLKCRRDLGSEQCDKATDEYVQFMNGNRKQYDDNSGFKTSLEKCQDAVKAITNKTTSTFEEIKKKFRELSKEHHPDHGGDGKKMTDLNAAWDAVKECKRENII